MNYFKLFINLQDISLDHGPLTFYSIEDTKKFGKLENWSVTGDNFPVGCKFTKQNTFYNKGYHRNNADYNDFFGIYKYECGFNNVNMSFNYAQYFADVLEKNNTN